MDVLRFLFLRGYFYRILNLEADILLINIRTCDMFSIRFVLRRDDKSMDKWDVRLNEGLRVKQ